MIGRLRGLVLERGLDGACIVEAAGVGYEVFVPLGSLGRLAEPPEEAMLHIHTHVREDALTLYGFASGEDRLAFRALIGVSSIGPKLALAILGALDAHQLVDAVHRQDRTRFKGISGVGKKTIERILLDLKEKLPASIGLSSRAAASVGPLPPAPTGAAAEVAEVLVQMGYKRAEAERAARSSASNEAEDRDLSQRVRAALAVLA